MVLMRLACTSTAGAMLHYSFKYLPLSTATTLFNLNPIFLYFLEFLYLKVPNPQEETL
jgi:drug/metabolite transporter (DMT)-like permease